MEDPRFVFYCLGHNRDPLSNMAPGSFSYMGRVYHNAEQAYQHVKALKLHRADLAERIWRAPTALEALRIARGGFTKAEKEVWRTVHKDGVVYLPLILAQKFRPGTDAARYLLSTGERFLVEATSHPVYGLAPLHVLGRKAYSPFSGPLMQEGRHGMILMSLRDNLRKSVAPAKKENLPVRTVARAPAPPRAVAPRGAGPPGSTRQGQASSKPQPTRGQKRRQSGPTPTQQPKRPRLMPLAERNVPERRSPRLVERQRQRVTAEATSTHAAPSSAWAHPELYQRLLAVERAVAAVSPCPAPLRATAVPPRRRLLHAPRPALRTSPRRANARRPVLTGYRNPGRFAHA